MSLEWNFQTRSQTRRAFTLVEMLVVIAVLGILAALLLPSLAKGKEKGRSTACLSNMRQLTMAAVMYAGDNKDQLPPRSGIPFWVLPLHPYYRDVALLKCPTDENGSARSYIINGWNDFFVENLSKEDFDKFMTFQWPEGMKLTQIPKPSDTVCFGEKRTGSPHAYMDILQGHQGNDVEELEHGRHGGGKWRRARTSNFGFSDGSARSLKFGQSLIPISLWATIDKWRNAPPPSLDTLE